MLTHCSLRQPDAAQSLSALMSSPVPSLKSLSLSVAVLDRFYFLYVTLRCDLELWPRDLDLWPLTFDLWPLTLNICSVSAVPWSNSVPNVSEIGQSAAELLPYDIWPFDLEHVSRVTLCCGIVCAKFKLRQAMRSWNVTIFWCQHVVTRYDLDPCYPLTLKVFGRSKVTWS